jgi:ABC-type bacteriocin/lantibiotic exporter with double-glycine peptidase domain
MKELLEQILPTTRDGVSAAQIVEAGGKLGLRVEPLHLDLSALEVLQKPAILHVDGSHFIAVLRFTDGHLVVFDNTIGLFECTPAWFHSHYQWNGLALVFGELRHAWFQLFRWPTILPFAASILCLVCVIIMVKRRRMSTAI